MTGSAANRTEEGLSRDGLRSRRSHRVARGNSRTADELSETVNIGHAQSILNIFRVAGHFADGCYILRLQAIGNAHFIEVGITRKRENGGILVLPAKLAHAILSGRLENRDFNCLALNRSIGLSSLTGGNTK